MADLAVLPFCLKFRLIALLSRTDIVQVWDVADPGRGRVGSWVMMALDRVRDVPLELKELAKTFM